MVCNLHTPFLNAIVISTDGREHLLVRAVLSINRVHYVVFIPVITQTAINDVMEEDWEDVDWLDENLEEPEYLPDMAEMDVEAVGFGRLTYDYENMRAAIEPMRWADEPDIVDHIMTTLTKLYS